MYIKNQAKDTKSADGIYSDKDIIYALPDEALLPYAEEIKEIDGMKLTPIIKYYCVPKEIIENSQQKILFP